MISQQGRVVSVYDDQVLIQIGSVSGCPACDAGKGCGAGIFGRLLRNRNTDIRLENSINASQGQLVNVGIPERDYVILVFRLYVVPLFAGLAGVIGGFSFAAILDFSHWMADLSGLLLGFLAAGFALILRVQKKREFPDASGVHLREVVVDHSCSNQINTFASIEFDEKR